MNTLITGSNTSSAISAELCPGNGTRYSAILVKLQEGMGCGSMGVVEPGGWLVASGMASHAAYLFQSTGELWEDYVAEKLELRLGPDSYYMTKIISEVMGRIPGFISTPAQWANRLDVD